MDILAALAADPNVAPAFRAAISPICPERSTYEAALRKHDWDFDHSDDHSVYTRGRAELKALQEQQRRVDANFRIWDSLAPASHRRGAQE